MGGFKRNETVNDSNILNNSGFDEGVETSMYGDKSTFKNAQESNMEKSMDDISNSEAQKNYFKVDKGGFPDNLNNGKFTMQMNG